MKRHVPASTYVEATLSQMGLTPPSQPEHHVPELPADLTNLDDRDLMLLFRELVEWTNFVGVRLSLAEADEAEAEGAHEVAKAHGMSEASARTVAASKASAMLTSEVSSARSRLVSAKALRKALQMTFNNLERMSSLVSREITRRGQFEPLTRRAARWTGG